MILFGLSHYFFIKEQQGKGEELCARCFDIAIVSFFLVLMSNDIAQAEDIVHDVVIFFEIYAISLRI